MNEVRQRWRLYVERGPLARDLAHRDALAAWETALGASGLPVGGSEKEQGGLRPRVTFAAPLPLGLLAEREPIDVALVERLRVHDVREAVSHASPVGYRLVDLEDVWVGAPTLPSLVVSADYRVTIRPGDVAGGADDASGALSGAVGELLSAPMLERTREKGGGRVLVDVRPHVLGLWCVTRSADPVEVLRMRLTLGGAGGVGRPEEIVSSIEGFAGRALPVEEIVRERINLAGDVLAY
jgi:radical SAM-linked protein